jgi:nitric oxide reductase NorQ protein
VAIPFNRPPAQIEARIVAHEAGVDEALAQRLAFLATKLRHLPPETTAEGPSTRLLIHTALLVRSGLGLRRAADVAIVEAVTDDAVVQEGMRDVVSAVLG